MAGGLRSKWAWLAIAIGLAAVIAVLLISLRGRDQGSSAQASGSASGAAQIVTKGPARIETSIPPPGTRLEGQVVDEQDRPAVGAQVRMWVKQKALTTTTEGDGSFFFEAVPDGTYAIGASTDKLASAPIVAKVADGAEPVILRLRPAGSVRVRVLAAETDSPIAGALVRTSDGKEATTDATGSVEIRGLSDFVQLVASAPRRALAEGNLQITPGSVAEHTFRLTLGFTLSGSVLGPDTKPVADAHVYVMPNAAGSGPQQRNAYTDHGGTWRVENLPAGSYSLKAASEDFAEDAPLTIDFTGDRSGVVVHVVTGAQLVGTVLDAGGKPAPNARVSITHEQRSWSSSTKCDATGRFALLGIPDGLYIVSADRDQQASSRQHVDVGPNQRVEVVLRLQDSSIAGIVVDSHGDGVAGVMVNARPMASPQEAGPIDTTDSGGRFDFGGLPPGEYELSVYRPEQQTQNLEGTRVKTGNRNVKLTLPGLTTLSGRVLLDGKPVPYFGVAVAEPAEWQWRQAFPKAVRAPDGRFSMSGVSTGAHAVVIAGPGFMRKVLSAQVTEGKANDLGDVTVEHGQRVTGRVVDGEGNPVAGAIVRVNQVSSVMIGSDDDQDKFDLVGAQQGTVKAVTSADGTFVLEGIAPPTQEPGRAKVPNQIRASHPDRGIAPPRDLPESTTTVELVLSQSGGIDGRISGEPSDHDWVTAHRVGAAPAESYTADIRDRKFRFEKLAPGDYQLVPTKNGGNAFNLSPTMAHVTSNQRTNAEIKIPKTVTVAVEPTSACHFIQITRPNANESWAGMIQCDGASAVIPGVEPGTYKFCVDGFDHCATATIAGAPARQTVKVP